MAKIVTITNPLTGQPAQVDQLDHTAQQIDDGLNIARGVSNPNLLDNWYFGNPVNQRGQTSYSGQGSYSIDRWILQYETNLEIVGDAIRLSGKWDMKQILERTLPNGTYTASVLYKNAEVVNDFWIYLDSSNGVAIFGSSTKETAGLLSCTFTVSGNDINRVRVAFQDDSGNSKVDILAIKLELGSQQTLAHQENGVWVLNEIPDYGEQLRRCQRYFVNFNPYKVGWFAMPPAVASNASQAYSAVTLPVAMRAQPVVAYGGNIVLSQDADHAVASILVSDNTFTGNSIQLRYDVSAGTLTANSLYRVQGNNDQTAYIWLSADL